MKLFHPEVFQGSKSKKNYFEGWYFKHASKDLEHVLSFIPGISLHPEDPHAFIQMLNGRTGKSQYYAYPVDAFHASSNSLDIRVGDSHFSRDGIDLHLRGDQNVSGKLSYSQLASFPRTLRAPGIMGWYSYVPRMETKHGVVSADHGVTGAIEIDGRPLDFTDGRGYIEKDWGTSFPESWVWMQSNSFPERRVSFMLSVAKIPWLGKFFIGFLGFLYIKGTYYIFASYNRSKIVRMSHADGKVDVHILHPKYELQISAKQFGTGKLRAPIQGQMSRIIKESIDSSLTVKLSEKGTGKTIYGGTGTHAGLEIIEKIFTYF